MLKVLWTLARPWRVAGRVRAIKDAALTQLRQVLDLQHAMRAEVRELHESTLLAAIRVIEEQRRAREELARDCARLEQRIAALEQQLGAGNTTEPPPARFDRAA